MLSLAFLAIVMVERWTLSPASAALFAVAGLADSGSGRALSLQGIRRLGASVSAPLQGSAAPLIATVAGLLLFHEQVSWLRWGAIALILTGTWLRARRSSANRWAGTPA